MSHKIEDIEGIGPKNAENLKKADVVTVEGLLKAGGALAGRKKIAEASGLSEKQVLKWVNMADLFRISGVGEEYSELLEASGVDTVVELATRNAENLTTKMAEVNETKKLVRALPTAAVVTKWVEQAKELPRAVSH